MDKAELLIIYPTFENIDVVKRTLPTIIAEVKRNDAKLIIHDSSVLDRDEKWLYLKEINEDMVFLILSDNISLAHARNMCLNIGQELFAPDYICMLEDDHGFHDGMIDSMMKAMKEYYGKTSPNGLRYGMFTGCSVHTHAILKRLDGSRHSYPDSKSDPFSLGGANNCFRCAPTSHWNNVLKLYDTDEYLISEFQTMHPRWRNYHKGFTVMFVENGEKGFCVEDTGRGMSSKSSLKLWDSKYCASDQRSQYNGKKGNGTKIRKKGFFRR